VPALARKLRIWNSNFETPAASLAKPNLPRNIATDICLHRQAILEERRLLIQWWAHYLAAYRKIPITPCYS
jgi:hypothetical protein